MNSENKSSINSNNLQTYLEAVISTVPGNFYWKDRDGHYLGCNKSFLNILKLKSSGEIIGKSDLDLWPTQAPLLKENDQEVIRLQKTMTFYEMIDIPGVGKKYFTTIKTPLVDENSTIIGVIGNSLDITSVKENEYQLEQVKQDAERKTKATKQFFEHIVSAVPGSIYWKNKEGVYLGCNEYMVKTAGLNSADQIVGKTDYQLWPTQAEVLRSNDHEVMTTGLPVRIEESVILHGGKQRFFAVVKMPLRDADHNIVGIIGNSLDITELKNTQLELEKAKEQAEAMSKAKSEFISNMSHDVKTPLSGIIGLAEILRNKLPNHESEFIDDIIVSGRQLMNFFDNCLEMARSEETSLILMKERFSLRAMLNQVIELFHPATKSKNLAFFIDYDETIPTTLIGNRSGIYRVLINLVGNAIKFTQQGSVIIYAKLSKKSNFKEAIIKLSVEDTGIGIPKDKQQVIFERFTRLVPSYRGTYEGSGVGLYIVDKFVKLMKGEVYVNSDEGEGSQFIVVLPLEIPLLADSEYAEDKIKISASSLAKTEHLQLSESNIPELREFFLTANQKLSKVLLIEDHVMTQKIAESILTSLNLQVDIASCGEKALELFKPGKYSLTVVDIGLPDIPGHNVIKRFREMEKRTPYHVPAIALTAHATETMREECLQAGLEEVHCKPLSTELAKYIIDNYIFAKNLTLTDSEHKKDTTLSRGNTMQPLDNTPVITADADKELLDLLMKTLPSSLTDMDKAYQAGNMDSLIKAVHKLHGGLCYTHTPRARAAAAALEHALKVGGEISEHIDKLYQNLIIAIKDFEKAYKLLQDS